MMIERDSKGRFVKGLIPHNKGRLECQMSKGELYDLYIEKQMSAIEIRKKIKCGYGSVLKRLRSFNIPIRRNIESTHIWFRKNEDTDYVKKVRQRTVKNAWDTKRRNMTKGKSYIYGCAELSMKNPERFSGRDNPFYGRHHTKEALEKMERSKFSKVRGKSLIEIYGKEKAELINKKRNKSLRDYYSNTDERREIERGSKISRTKRELIRKGLLNPMRGNTRHSRPELVLKEIIERNNLPFNYVGRGDIYFHSENKSFNPDFLSKNPKHIIEVFGDYWHNRADMKSRDINRLQTYQKYGYKTLIIWEHEIVHYPKYGSRLTEEQIINKIKEFIK